MSNESIEQRHRILEDRVKNIEEILKELKYFLSEEEVSGDAAELRESILNALENGEYRIMTG